MAMQDYATLKVFLNGSPITQLTSISKSQSNGQQRIDLLNEGLGGFTPGPGEVTIEIGYPIPIGGPEFDYDGMNARAEFVDMQLFQGRFSYAGRGKITETRVSQSTGAAAEGSATWVGELKPPES